MQADFSRRICDDHAEGGYVQESLAEKYQEKLEELQRFSTYRTLEEACLGEMPNQCLCGTCGQVFLWRSSPKSWELASWQVASPFEASCGKSEHYLNGKQPSCSLCTEVVCVDCPRVFPWGGDQFHRSECPCGGAVEVRQRWDAEQRDAGFAEEFSFRCSCCGLLEVCDELAYLCRDEPEDCYASAELDRPAVYFGGHVDCMSKRLLSPAASGELPRGTEYVFGFPIDSAQAVFKTRSRGKALRVVQR